MRDTFIDSFLLVIFTQRFSFKTNKDKSCYKPENVIRVQPLLDWKEHHFSSIEIRPKFDTVWLQFVLQTQHDFQEKIIGKKNYLDLTAIQTFSYADPIR